jgi:hypothetical protein
MYNVHSGFAAMHPFLWKGVSAALILVVVFQLLWHQTPFRQPFTRPAESQKPIHVPIKDQSLEPDWTYDWERDRDDYTLSSAQCDAAFPELYNEIDRATELWTNRSHTITPQDIDISWRRDAAFRVLINNGQVRVTESRDTMNDAYVHRTLAVLHQIQRAVVGAGPEHLPPIEFSVCVDDMSLIPNSPNDTHAILHFARNTYDRDQDRLWLIPDFNFWASAHRDSFADMQRKSRTHDSYLVDKTPKAVWRGVEWTNGVRHDLLNVTTGKDWADVLEVNWKNKTNLMSPDMLCDYSFLIHTEGRSWSGRLKDILNCDSVPIIHNLEWTTHYYHLLNESGSEQNYVPVKRDFSDLEEKVAYYIAHMDEAQTIANRAVDKFRQRYTTPAAQACYWRKLFHSWSTVAFVPDLYRNVTVEKNGKNETTELMRGVTFEDFA